MTRARAVVCAAGLFCLFATGCEELRTFDLSGSASLLAQGKDRMVAGSLESVAASTQESLQELGLFAAATREGQAIRITATTKAGGHFSLVLTRQKSEQGEMTRVHFDWDKGRDESTETQILAQVEIHKRQ